MSSEPCHNVTSGEKWPHNSASSGQPHPRTASSRAQPAPADCRQGTPSCPDTFSGSVLSSRCLSRPKSASSPESHAINACDAPFNCQHRASLSGRAVWHLSHPSDPPSAAPRPTTARARSHSGSWRAHQRAKFRANLRRRRKQRMRLR